MSLAALLVLAAQAATPAAPSQDAAWHNRQQLALAERGAAQGWHATASGLRWRRVKGSGNGARPSAADRVTVHYAGRFVDGSEFDSSIARGEPATFPLGRVVKGWTEGVQLAGVGDTIELAIPAELAYGFKGRGPIPGGATLLFTIELIAIAPPAP
ncbi:FKBP-type peptidyl-prolyl cis-trans isomerase [Sphingomonas sp.]|uniref:FKBP-type peptidyl-prolyl cis-trans isomerase n=1 Tax=Sphingomonas sp. TaxID=28214 RepID=UPI0031E2D3DE